MLYRVSLPAAVLLIASVAGALTAPSEGLIAQALDSTGMPPLEQLALEAGRASRRHPIRAVTSAMLCEQGHPLVDSASLAACAVLSGPRAAAITAAFARGLDVPLDATPDGDTPADLPTCPAAIERTPEPRVLVARITAPLAGVREGVWEGRLTVELRCQSPSARSGQGVRTMGKEYLYQWSGREWKLYQHSWWRAER